METAQPRLETVLSRNQLPALPQSAMKLLELSRDLENGPAEFAVPIEADAGLASQVLRFVNSSYFGFSGEVSSVKLAITLVGIRTVKNFAMWSAVFTLVPNPRCGDFDLKRLWTDSLRRALFARILAQHVKLEDSEGVFSASLLQDMALPLLAKELPLDYHELLERRNDGRVRLSELERERFGWSHADATAVLAEHWSLPDQLMELCSSHIDLDLSNPNLDRRDKFIVGLSSHLPSSVDSRWHERPIFESAFGLLGSDLPEIHQLFAEVDSEFEAFAPIMNLASESQSLVDYWNEAEPAVSA